MLDAMSRFNTAAEQAAHQGLSCECSICQDTLGPNLAVVVLPNCKHRFHEICIQTWLSPIQLPDTTREPVTYWSAVVDVIFRQIEERATVWEALAQLPLGASLRRGAVPICREAIARMTAGTEIDSDVEEALEAAYDQDEEMSDGTEVRTPEAASRLLMLDDIADHPITEGDEEEELEEGEIRENPQPHQIFQNLLEQAFEAGVLIAGQRPSQDLPKLSADYVYDDIPFTPRESSHQCPFCRSSAFLPMRVSCHADTLQLIRVRLRLTDLAYRCLGFTRTDQESKDRGTIIKFLNRRHADNIILGEREIPLTPSSCRRVFKQARSILRKEACIYANDHGLEYNAAEYVHVAKFGTFFEKFRLRDEDIAFFFDANPAFNEILWEKGFKLMEYHKGPLTWLLEKGDRRYFRMLKLDGGVTPHSYAFPPPPSSSDDAWFTDEDPDEDPDLSKYDD
ncbi:MAG: hypothetical protein Q9209_006240 [Squamulea sp. 1 TL-2023]